MKTILQFTFIITLLGFMACQERVVESGEYEGSIPTDMKDGYNEALANRLGADEYGMHQYVMAFLKAGPNRDRSKEESDKLQRAHMDNINRLAEAGKLVVAGPFLDGGKLKGIYIFDVKTIEEAQELTETDPAIQAGSLVMELHPWYGSAALMQVNEIHKKVAKTEI